MTEEVAGMPQSMLREVVMRLICPEKTPATDIFRTDAARKLVRSPEAVDFLNRFNAQAPLLDEIAKLFLEVAEAPPSWGSNPRQSTAVVFEEVLYAYRVVMLGASPATMERLMVELVRGGWWRQAEAIAAKLDRQLTRAEVLGLVRSYTEGAVYGSSSDQWWPEFAQRYLGAEGGQLVRGWIQQRNDRSANDLY